MNHRSRTLAFAWMAVVAVAAAASSACHEEGDVRVAGVSFEGNRAFKTSQLDRVIVTRATGWLPWARPRYFSRAVFDADLTRVKAFYDDRGYPNARVTAADVAFNDKRDEVRLRIHVDEGEPVLVERVAFSGLEQSPREVTDALESLPLRVGAPRDRQLVAATRERVTFLLRDHGYPHARVVAEESPGTSVGQLVVTIVATPGAAATFGDVKVVGLASVHESLVRRTLAFAPAEVYRESLVLESQRRLRKLGIFEFAHVRGDPQAEAPPTDRSRVPMVVTISEGRPTRTQLGFGYGSEDGPRGSARWEHLNFLGDARRFSVDARYSTRLRGGGIEYVEPYFLRPTISFTARLGSWWTDEPTHTARTRGGRFGLNWRRSSERGVDLDPIDHVVRVEFVSESLQFAIDPATLADLSQFENLISLGLDPVTGQGNGRLASLDLGLERTAVDNRVDPQSGHALSLRLKHAAPWLGGLYRYDEAIAEGRVYVPIVDRHVWATRARVGAIVANESAPVPISERFFLGGSTTLRGWGRYQVAPLTPDGLPVGGRALLDLSTEWRMTIRGSFGAAVFVDAGNVWSAAEGLGAGRIRADAGPGIRWVSPLGIIRADLGIQLTPIENLKVNGQPEKRKWRIHFSIGHPF